MQDGIGAEVAGGSPDSNLGPLQDAVICGASVGMRRLGMKDLRS